MNRRLFLCALGGTALHAADAIEALEQATVARLRVACERVDGVAGVAAIDLTSGHTLTWNASVVCPSASTIKVPILAAVYRHLDPAQTVSLAPGDLIASSERLELLLRRGPATLTVRELASAMIEVSDNTATNALIRLAGMERVNALLDEFGLSATRLRRKMLDVAAARRGDDNTSTPLELARIAQLLHRGKLGPEEMLGFMKRVEADLRRTVPSAVEVASKPGNVPGARAEMGIVFVPRRPFAVGIMSAFLRDGVNPIPGLAAILYTHFERLSKSNQFGNSLE